MSAITPQGSGLYSRSGVLLIAGVLTLFLITVFADMRYSIEQRLGALGWRLFPSAETEERITIVAIDEASLEQVGPWPWSRATMAQLSQRLRDAGAALQIYDVVFPEPKPGDDLLIESFANNDVVIGVTPVLDSQFAVQTGTMAGAITDMRCQPPIASTNSFVANHGGLATVPAGHITPLVDADGMIRKQPALLCVQGRVYPSLAIQSLLQGFDGATGHGPELKLVKGQGVMGADWHLQLSTYTGIQFPVDDQGNIRFPYHLSPSAFQYISAVDVIEGRAPQNLLDNAWVLVGATAFGLGDIVPTPHEGGAPGIELQARMLSGLLDNQIPYEPAGSDLLQLLESLLFAVCLLLISSRRHRFAAFALPVAVILLPLIAWSLHVWLLASSIWLGWLAPALFGLCAASFLSLFEQRLVRIERQRVYTHLSSYLPSEVASSIAFTLPSGAIEAERKDLVLMCADLRNFSAYEEARPPEESAALLHCFFVKASQVIESHGGIVEEFKGDSVLASWSAADNAEPAAMLAYRAGQELFAEMAGVVPKKTPKGLEPLALGIGIEKGPVLTGSIGPSHRRTHTLLGDTVTITLRIQSMTQDLAQPILVGECAARDIDSDLLESQGSFLLDDLQTPHVLFAGIDEELIDDAPDDSERDDSVVHLKVVKGK